MKCPTCGETLSMTERHGVEVDYCPQCRGTWLDRGELDRIIEAARGVAAPPAPAPATPPSLDRSWPDDRGDRGDPPRKKRSRLADLLEFGD
ncbi:MAG TPA: zf-TFIIB domain-containing protein [Actinomycetota bacterium]|nr:zf-TFIIB domain-containing protein [Actinomycetota bacterium]